MIRIELANVESKESHQQEGVNSTVIELCLKWKKSSFEHIYNLSSFIRIKIYFPFLLRLPTYSRSIQSLFIKHTASCTGFAAHINFARYTW